MADIHSNAEKMHFLEPTTKILSAIRWASNQSAGAKINHFSQNAVSFIRYLKF